MCSTHFHAASALLPEHLVVISIDKKRLQRFHLEASKYSSTVFSQVKNLQDPVIISKPAVHMAEKDTLQGAMHQWSSTWNLTETQLRLGEIGCTLAHLAALQHASRCEGVVAICEDDVLFSEGTTLDNLKTLLVANTAPGAWGLLRIGQHAASSCHTYESCQLTRSTKLAWGATRWGTYFYIVTPDAAQRTLDTLQKHPELYDFPSDFWISHATVCEAANVKFVEPSFVKYRTDVISATLKCTPFDTQAGMHSARKQNVEFK